MAEVILEDTPEEQVDMLERDAQTLRLRVGTRAHFIVVEVANQADGDPANCSHFRLFGVQGIGRGQRAAAEHRTAVDDT